MSRSAVSVQRALESAESILASLLDRGVFGPPEGGIDGGNPDHSLVGVGLKSSTPLSSTAVAPASKDTLRAIALRTSSASLPSGQVEEKLSETERDLEVAARVGLALLERNDILEQDLTRVTEQLANSERMLAQARHELGQKTNLLKQYYQLHEEDSEPEQGDEGKMPLPTWVKSLTEENSQLHEANQQLWAEKQQLQQEAHKERALVKQCFDQLAEAKQQLDQLQNDRQQGEEQLEQELERRQLERDQLAALCKEMKQEEEELREKIDDANNAITLLTVELTEFQELKDKYDACSTLLQETQEELSTLKDQQARRSRESHKIPEEGEHESIVQEIEEVLRQELIAASTLPERPPSPNNYARQRTMVVMETVRAATMATARRLERLAAERREKDTTSNDDAVAAFGETKNTSIHSDTPSMPLVNGTSDGGDVGHMKHPHYVSPQKLQIVKPMEGSVTLLRWKLLATPQLGGATSFFSDAELPGVLRKDSGFSRPDSAMMLGIPSQPGRKWHSVSDLSQIGIAPVQSLQWKTPPRRGVPTIPSSPLLASQRKGFGRPGIRLPSSGSNRLAEREEGGRGLQELLGQ